MTLLKGLLSGNVLEILLGQWLVEIYIVSCKQKEKHKKGVMTLEIKVKWLRVFSFFSGHITPHSPGKKKKFFRPGWRREGHRRGILPFETSDWVVEAPIWCCVAAFVFGLRLPFLGKHTLGGTIDRRGIAPWTGAVPLHCWEMSAELAAPAGAGTAAVAAVATVGDDDTAQWSASVHPPHSTAQHSTAQHSTTRHTQPFPFFFPSLFPPFLLPTTSATTTTHLT